MDASGRFSILKFRSGKCHRIVHSAMAAEACAFAEAFDASFVVKYELERLLKRPTALQMLVDSKQIFDAVTQSTRTTEKRLLLDLAAAKQSFERGEISEFGLVTTDFMLADCLTKPMKALQFLAASSLGKLSHPIAQWVIRDSHCPQPVSVMPLGF
eukprot:Plantae.Rhodophyta-Palmaria_palmata.ctg4150.p2 GENE.Plantae.Rhodophyta-Palmaria_palmata.ctg4150~~Plantae.Rhodophyta-Palmaria_palmata.ctg4150.p2  ORF type:complete len:156 (-),score=20.32 Plantae.Rhodophyta-Palmaria_palmata.ctg4150:275-742(-)